MYRILVVDDEAAIVKLLQEFLRKFGFEVIKAAGGEEALAMLCSPEAFDLMIVDMKMPKVAGLEVLREFKKTRGETPFIVLTGSIDIERNEKELAEAGCTKETMLYKPVDLFLLLGMVKKLLGIQ